MINIATFACFLIIMVILMVIHLIVHLILNRDWFEVSNNFKWYLAQMITWIITAIIILNSIGGKI